jgi:hypothetical protein
LWPESESERHKRAQSLKRVRHTVSAHAQRPNIRKPAQSGSGEEVATQIDKVKSEHGYEN